jgi:hypothetical protein
VKVDRISGLERDYLSSHIRHQIHTLKSLLDTIENAELIEYGYLNESLRLVMQKLNNIRKSIT